MYRFHDTMGQLRDALERLLKAHTAVEKYRELVDARNQVRGLLASYAKTLSQYEYTRWMDRALLVTHEMETVDNVKDWLSGLS